MKTEVFFYQSSSINSCIIFNTCKFEQVWYFSAKWGSTDGRTDRQQRCTYGQSQSHGIPSKSVADFNKDKPGTPPVTDNSPGYR